MTTETSLQNLPEVIDTSVLTPAEEKKVEEAFNELKNIFVKNIYKSMLESGQYLIKTFYDNDYKKAVEKPFKDNKSLNALFTRLSNEAYGDAPKKNMAIRCNKFSNL